MVEQRPRGARLWLFRASLILPVLLFLLLLETGARLHAYYSDRTLQQGLDGVGLVAAADDLSLQHIIRWHANPKIIYDLIPGLEGVFRGHPLTINQQGFRSPPVPEQPPEDGLRIVGIGDSVMFGWGVGDEDNYIAQLGRQLTKRLPEVHIDWINSAVPGYNTVNEVETLKEKLLDYLPDVVIVGYVNNDLHPPGFLRKSQPYFSLKKSFLAQFVRNSIDGLHVPDNELQRPPDDFRRRSFAGEEELIPDAYREVIGIDAFQSAIMELQQLATRHGFDVLVFANYGFASDVLNVLNDQGIRTLDGYPTIRNWLETNGIQAYRGSPLTVSNGDSHPSALQHRLIAGLLLEEVIRMSVPNRAPPP